MIRDSATIVEEHSIAVVERVLPRDSAGIDHRVVPKDLHVGVFLSLEVFHERLHLVRVSGISAPCLLIDEPAVKAVMAGDLDELVGDRETAVTPLLHEVVDPPELAAVRRGRKKHRT